MVEEICEPLLEPPSNPDSPDGTPAAAKPLPSTAPAYSAADVIAKLNVQNAKLVAVLLIVGFVVYHGVLRATYGTDSCKWLLSDGRFQGNNVWQPYGCMIHTYSPTNAQTCAKYSAFLREKNKVVFIGDSR
jgi:hypothetical protein